MQRGTRSELLGRLAEAIESRTTAHPLRVAVDGPPAAGKTTLADQLAGVLRGQGREVIRASIEGFLLPEAQRYRRGEYSPEGCYEDSFDYDALHRVLLDPLGPGGDRRFRPAVYDRRADTALLEPRRTASADAVLLFDGVFLLRPELIDRWDLRIFVSVAFERTAERARIRDRELSEGLSEDATVAILGSAAEVERRWRLRYIPSQQHYLATVGPTDRADIVVHNDDFERPAWEVRIAAPTDAGWLPS